MNVIVRRIGYALGAIVVLILVASAGVYLVSSRMISAKVDAPSESITVPTDSASIVRGRHLARAIAKCVECHGDDLGGKDIVANGAFGHWAGRNLTRGTGGLGATLTDADFARAIRQGVAPDGRHLLLMPSSEYVHLSATDLADLIAYVRAMPQVDRDPGAITFGPVSRTLIALGKLPVFDADQLDHSLKPGVAPPEGPTAEYGKYLVRVAGCMGCHGPTLSGGKIPSGDPSWPPAANLTPTGIARYSESDFTAILRTAKRPDGSSVNPVMPVHLTREMTDDEIRAVYAYLRTVPPKAFGGR